MKLGCCGLDCEKCDAYIATSNNDDSLREKIAKAWTVEFGFECSPDMINCTGCLSDGVKIGHCDECTTRSCAMSKGLDNCSFCSDFPCEDMAKFMESVPEAKTNLML